MHGTIEQAGLSARLKAANTELHQAAEHHPFQRAFAAGRLPREGYTAYLGQLLHVHRALEAELRRHRASLPALGAVLTDEQYQEPYLKEDLAHFGVNDEPPALASTRHVADKFRKASATSPIGLLGYHYVLEGSNNGSRFIAKGVRRAYGLEGAAGTRYLDPYGERQPQTWAKFKQDLDGAAVSPAEAEAIIAAAADMFRGISLISDELNAAFPTLPITGAPQGAAGHHPHGHK